MHPGPVNRGVELAAEVIDSPQSLIVDQVASGLVVRMAILYELLSAGSGGNAARTSRYGPTERAAGMSAAPAPIRGRAPRVEMRTHQPAEVLVRSAVLLDPRASLEGRHDVLVRGGEIAEIAAPGAIDAPAGAETLDADGLHLFPAFVDPHVHLRTPGREDEEDLESGTRAAAAGGFCCILAMPNTDPVVDNASVLGSLHERAAIEAQIPVGFLRCGDERARRSRADRDGGAVRRGGSRLHG